MAKSAMLASTGATTRCSWDPFAGLASVAAIPSTSIDSCRNIVSYRGSCSPMVMKPTTEAGVQEECIVMELLEGGE